MARGFLLDGFSSKFLLGKRSCHIESPLAKVIRVNYREICAGRVPIALILPRWWWNLGNAVWKFTVTCSVRLKPGFQCVLHFSFALFFLCIKLKKRLIGFLNGAGAVACFIFSSHFTKKLLSFFRLLKLYRMILFRFLKVVTVRTFTSTHVYLIAGNLIYYKTIFFKSEMRHGVFLEDYR